jgi:hypothetical protein
MEIRMSKLEQICFIGGASKSGTTALYYYLKQHPDLFLSEKKELHFFSRPELATHCDGPGDKFVLDEIPTTFEQYIAHFNAIRPGQVAFDISPSYLHFSGSADRIRAYFPHAKFVFILRNPADKAFSQYNHLRSTCRETLSFTEALERESMRAEAGYSDMWLYRDSGFYADRISKFLDVFGSGHVRIYLFDDFIREPSSVLGDLCAFVGVRGDIDFAEPGEVNVSGEPRSKLLAKTLLQPNRFTRLLRRLLPHDLGRWMRENIRKFNAGQKTQFPPELRSALLADYADDVQRLEALLGRSTGWIR